MELMDCEVRNSTLSKSFTNQSQVKNQKIVKKLRVKEGNSTLICNCRFQQQIKNEIDVQLKIIRVQKLHLPPPFPSFC